MLIVKCNILFLNFKNITFLICENYLYLLVFFLNEIIKFYFLYNDQNFIAFIYGKQSLKN